jgi:hypothetical protein
MNDNFTKIASCVVAAVFFGMTFPAFLGEFGYYRAFLIAVAASVVSLCLTAVIFDMMFDSRER